MSEQSEVKQMKGGQRRGRSVFAPIFLIAAGTIFLLANLGIIPQPNWASAFGYWPLLLILIGLDILVTQLRAPVGTFLSLLVSLITVGLFSYLLLSGPDNAAARALGIDNTAQEILEYPFSVPVDGATAANLELDLGNFPSAVTDSSDGQILAAGSVWTAGEFVLDIERDGQTAEVTIGQNSHFTTFLNPQTWFAEPVDRTWRINLNRDLPLNLQINSGNGAASLDLDGLSFSQFRLNSANGSVTATLPDGDYEGQIEGGNGAIQVSLPSDGRQTMRVDTGNGSAQLVLPTGVPARVEFETGNGSVSVDSRFNLVEGDSEEGTFETADYASSGDGIMLQVDTGNGSLQISQP